MTNEVININEVIDKPLKELIKKAKELKIENAQKLNKEELQLALIEKSAQQRKALIGWGELDIMPDGYGFIKNTNVTQNIYVSASQVRRFSLRIGDIVVGEVREPLGDEKNYALLKVLMVNYTTLEKSQDRPRFDDLVPLYPTDQIKLESSKINAISSRVIDLISPIGKGQRALIVAPPKAGKTMLIAEMANSIIANYPDIKLWLLLVDERPEEVTDIKDNVKGAEVFASTFDEEPKNHVKIAESILEKAKREVENGKDIVILMDSITRLARSYNIIVPSSGKIISGGLDPTAFYMPKRFFGAARNIKNGGSLTIIATALVDTGSKMDDIIYEEFKGTGNMEIHLDREQAEFRIYPAIDIKRSGTRREELLIEEKELDIIWNIRRYLSKNFNTLDASRKLIELIKGTKNNAELLKKFMAQKDIK